ncbi:hypothetical protein PIB30_011798 [Stylosanthes scabra]|uniref:Pectinesterase inhibitor domain-containing protein n=1 Tax=Stylosanthes scabra TaxID=79078 RepID=A0ABU6R5S2_9FABA|nr:hypothetical protein [Stylosanthes scabra]
MASFMSRTPLFLVVFLATAAAFATAADAIPVSRNFHIVQHRLDLSEEIGKFCQNTTNSTLCSKILQPHFESEHFDQFKALDIILDATNDQAKLTLAAIQTLNANKDTPKTTKDSLKICKGQYKNILDSVKETKATLASKNVIDAKFKASAIISFYESCKDSFDGAPVPFAEQAEPVFDLSGNCLDIITAIQSTLPAPPLVMNSPPSQYSNVIGPIS